MLTQETYFINTCYALVCIIIILICRILWYAKDVPNIELHFTESSSLFPKIIENCKSLNEKYVPTYLWGKSGHFQSILHTFIGRVGDLPLGQSRRFQISAIDGSILSYDIFEPVEKTVDELVLMVPGLCNHAESKYIRAFSDTLISNGYRVAVFNHTGALKTVELKRPRIFTYGQTDDLDTVVNHLLHAENVEKFIGIGFSLGGNILMKYLGENVERQKHFLFAASVCQGYDIPESADYFRAGENLRWIYDYGLTRNMLKVVNHHKDNLVTYCQSEKPPINVNWDKVFASRALGQLDEAFTLKFCKKSDIDAFYKENSSSQFMNKISIPMLIINALDDPIVPESLFKYPKKLVGVNKNTLFVVLPFGGHLGFFEGGIIIPNKMSWMDRMLTEFFQVATKVIKEESKIDLNVRSHIIS